VTDETPALASLGIDRADRVIGTAPPANGSILRVVEFPPVTPDVEALDRGTLMRAMGLDHHAPDGALARHPYTHRTRSVDYAIILSGEIDMLLDDSEVHLAAGDVVIQQGTNHAWVNRSSNVCRIAFVLLDAHDPPKAGPDQFDPCSVQATDPTKHSAGLPLPRGERAGVRGFLSYR
jgi:hypothetical protein